jgi:hypothetical protein
VFADMALLVIYMTVQHQGDGLTAALRTFIPPDPNIPRSTASRLMVACG